MTDGYKSTSPDSTSPVTEEYRGEVQEALREKEQNAQPAVPAFTSIMKAIHQKPSLATDQPIPFMRRVRSCGPLIRAQFRLIPRYILLVEIAIAACSILISNFMQGARYGSLGMHIFSNMLMVTSFLG